MSPIIGIMSSRCDVSVYSSCLNTWCYLLHTLDSSVNSPSMIKSAWEPVFDAVFQVTPNNKSIWVWDICLDLLDDSILIKSGELDGNLNNQVNYQLSAKIPCTGPLVSSDRPWKLFPIKWLPWDLNKLDFCFKIIQNLINQGPMVNVLMEAKCMAYDSALRIFRSVMKGVRNVFNNSSTNYDDIMSCLNKILGLLKVICQSTIPENSDCNRLRLTTLPLCRGCQWRDRTFYSWIPSLQGGIRLQRYWPGYGFTDCLFNQSLFLRGVQFNLQCTQGRVYNSGRLQIF